MNKMAKYKIRAYPDPGWANLAKLAQVENFLVFKFFVLGIRYSNFWSLNNSKTVISF